MQVDSDYETHEARVIFAKLPSDIHERKVLLLYPIMSSGNKVCRAMQVNESSSIPLATTEHCQLLGSPRVLES